MKFFIKKENFKRKRKKEKRDTSKMSIGEEKGGKWKDAHVVC